MGALLFFKGIKISFYSKKLKFYPKSLNFTFVFYG
jgi:hypothetical protein